ncbi:hypothetical protein K458DRAFT_44516 [Lentithecium fluviatile CBS 122367]|uniref:Uncharacterized protein n=1 Tax=Lentithecium fluviatile CBS 122367 TaxID=1168545 RepID=A0A6G1IYE7_9PLEO|nr:hypothetical protein K458DRAFT_44516 [Lentithecium fluviatile CBS 122367]
MQRFSRLKATAVVPSPAKPDRRSAVEEQYGSSEYDMEESVSEDEAAENEEADEGDKENVQPPTSLGGPPNMMGIVDDFSVEGYGWKTTDAGCMYALSHLPPSCPRCSGSPIHLRRPPQHDRPGYFQAPYPPQLPPHQTSHQSCRHQLPHTHGPHCTIPRRPLHSNAAVHRVLACRLLAARGFRPPRSVRRQGNSAVWEEGSDH